MMLKTRKARRVFSITMDIVGFLFVITLVGSFVGIEDPDTNEKYYGWLAAANWFIVGVVCLIGAYILFGIIRLVSNWVDKGKG